MPFLFQSTLLCFSVNGVFKEGKNIWGPEFAEWVSHSEAFFRGTLRCLPSLSLTTSCSAPKPPS